MTDTIPIPVGTPDALTADGVSWLNREHAESAFYYVSQKRDQEMVRRTDAVNRAYAYIASPRPAQPWRVAGQDDQPPGLLGRLWSLWRRFCGEPPEPMERHHRPSLFEPPKPQPEDDSCVLP